MPFDFKQGINITEIAGTGTEDDGSDNLRLAAQGNGIAGGAGSTLSVDSDTETGGNIQGANVTSNGVGVDINAISGTGLEADGSANLRIDTGSTVSFAADTPVWTFGNETTGEGLFVSGSAVDDNHVVNKVYVDTRLTGLDKKHSVKAATDVALAAVTAAGSKVGKTLTADGNGALTIDTITGFTDIDTDGGVNDPFSTSAQADRVLIQDQVAGADNGIYAVQDKGTAGTPFILVRATDADADAEVTANLYVFSAEGSVNADRSWTLSTNDPITVDTTALSFTQFSGLGQVTAGDGLTKSGDTINVVGGDGITANTNDIAVDQGDGLQIGGGVGGAAQLNIDVSDFAGTGLEDDSSENLRIASQGNGIAGGAGSTLSVASDTATGVTVAAVSVTSNGVGVAIDNDTIVHDNGGPDVLSVGADSIGTAEIAEGEAFAFTEATGTTETPGDNSTKLATTAYTDAAVAAGTGANPTSGNKFQASAVVSADETTTGLTIAATPASDSHVDIDVNGISEELGSGVKTAAFYYSSDGGTTAKTIAAIASGDTLFYNAVINGYDLATSDLISQNYNV